MHMQGSFGPGAGRVAKIKVRILITVPSGAEAQITDIMLQPGGSSSGWLPHVTELPWSAGVVP